MNLVSATCTCLASPLADHMAWCMHTVWQTMGTSTTTAPPMASWLLLWYALALYSPYSRGEHVLTARPPCCRALLSTQQTQVPRLWVQRLRTLTWRSCVGSLKLVSRVVCS